MRETRLNQLEQAVEELKDELAGVKDELAEEREKRREAEERAERQEKHVQTLFAHVRNLADKVGKAERTAVGAHERINKVEDGAGEVEGRTDETEPDSPPISQICSLPEHMAREQLGPNQQRARRFFKDVAQYTQKVGGGRRIKAGELKRVLRASEPDDSEAQIESKTVERVMKAVRSLTRGVAEITQERKHGERTLYIPDDWADQARERAPSRTPGGGGPSDAAVS